MKKVILVLAIGLGFVLMAGGAFAASDTKNLTVNATVSGRASLTLGQSAINFPDADPDVTFSIPANENAVSVTAKIRTGSASAATLTHLAAGDLVSGTDTIAINNVTWTVASGAGFQPGTMSSSAPQTAGSWTGSGNRVGSFNYLFANSWAYATGNYTASSTYTLSAP